MLPLADAWYRKQLLAAVFLGVFGGLFALAFSIVTTWAIDGLFGDATSDPWSGEWWWIALTAGGAVPVSAHRSPSWWRAGAWGRGWCSGVSTANRKPKGSTH